MKARLWDEHYSRHWGYSREQNKVLALVNVVYQMAVSAIKKNKRVRKTGVGNLSKTVILYRVVFKATRLDKVTQGAKVGREKKRSGNWAIGAPNFRSKGGKEEPANGAESELRTVLTWMPTEKKKFQRKSDQLYHDTERSSKVRIWELTNCKGYWWSWKQLFWYSNNGKSPF